VCSRLGTEETGHSTKRMVDMACWPRQVPLWCTCKQRTTTRLALHVRQASDDGQAMPLHCAHAFTLHHTQPSNPNDDAPLLTKQRRHQLLKPAAGCLHAPQRDTPTLML
jgi:hypothetical protein